MSSLVADVVAGARSLRGVARFATGMTVILVLTAFTTAWFPWDYTTAFYQVERWTPTIFLLAVALVPLVALRSPLLAVAVGLSPLVLVWTGASVVPWTMDPALLAAGLVATLTTGAARAGLVFLASLVPVLGYVSGWWSLAVPGGGQVDSSYGAKAGVELGIYAAFTLVTIVVAGTVRSSSRRESVRGARAVEVEAESTVVAERARLARDLHDVVAHHISLIAVRAETAPYTVPDLSDGAKAVLAEIAGDARRSLDELRHVLGVLRRSDDSGSRAPLPTLSDLPALIERVRSAGDVVAIAGLDHVTAPSAVSVTQSYVAYRVIQEALTNARRHAPHAPVSIAIAVDGSGTLDITVTNPAPTTTQAVVEGRGLLGIRERVEALDGTTRLEHGHGHHTLHVTLPGKRHPPAPRAPADGEDQA